MNLSNLNLICKLAAAMLPFAVNAVSSCETADSCMHGLGFYTLRGSGVLLKWRWVYTNERGEGHKGTLLIYDHRGEYTLSKKLGGWYTPYIRVYPPNTPLLRGLLV